MAKSYFAILEITSNATPSEIHSAYRRLAKAYHPDHYDGGSEPFQQIQEAYSVLGNPARRKAYEKTLVNVRVRKAPDIGPTVKPEPLIPEKEPVHMGDISPVRSFETFSPSFEAAISVAFPPGLMKDHSVVIPLDRFGIRNLHCTVLFRPRDMD
ncbi:DnaJ: heat shock protein [Desulfosarcina variabilis str. Montpellier]|uniref:J domain-containing protein n=1 Tax=Desulfosarcina variabilis TaxID=2300 RepID=UPI003AFB5FF9